MRGGVKESPKPDRMLILKHEQHEMIWEMVISHLPEKVSDNPELHYLAHKIAKAPEIEQPLTVGELLRRMKTAVMAVLT